MIRKELELDMDWGGFDSTLVANLTYELTNEEKKLETIVDFPLFAFHNIPEDQVEAYRRWIDMLVFITQELGSVAI